MTQMLLWNDIRVPLEYMAHFHQLGTCLNCHQTLRHEMHAFNHYSKYHTQKKKARYWVWSGPLRKWMETTIQGYLVGKHFHRPTARSQIRPLSY